MGRHRAAGRGGGLLPGRHAKPKSYSARHKRGKVARSPFTASFNWGRASLLPSFGGVLRHGR